MRLEFFQQCGHQIKVNTWTGTYMYSLVSVQILIFTFVTKITQIQPGYLNYQCNQQNWSNQSHQSGRSDKSYRQVLNPLPLSPVPVSGCPPTSANNWVPDTQLEQLRGRHTRLILEGYHEGNWTRILLYIYFIMEFALKLDGVGPVDNRPSTDSLHHFFQFFLKDIYIYIFFFIYIYFFLMKNM